ncbi:hypothetical protein CSOJ01_01429 [Colletotrichum sojae]|uniref:Uncharacterized protein n=1 Tax=Colletotrichum sojae TaxID=2175907 RepID=A0A8H6JU09_9PEZI|nr:hypothetical protein CSOJ01_01429 [Colletotrichum sojae]
MRSDVSEITPSCLQITVVVLSHNLCMAQLSSPDPLHRDGEVMSEPSSRRPMNLSRRSSFNRSPRSNGPDRHSPSDVQISSTAQSKLPQDSASFPKLDKSESVPRFKGPLDGQEFDADVASYLADVEAAGNPSFRPQPKYKPNHFAGPQNRPFILLEASGQIQTPTSLAVGHFTGPDAFRPQVGRPSPHRTSRPDGNGNEPAGSSPPQGARNPQISSITSSHFPQPARRQVENLSQIPTPSTSRSVSLNIPQGLEPLEYHGDVAEHRQSPPTNEAGGRPFSDADRLLQNDQGQSLIDQQSLRPQDSMADRQTVLEDTGSAERHETVPIQPARSARTPTRDRNSHPQVNHTPAGVIQKHRNPVHRVSKEHLSRQTRPQTPVGDLGMPQDLPSGHRSISTTARKHQRQRAPRPQSELRTSKAGLEKLQEEARGYKDFLNKAIEEHQMLYQETKEKCEQTIKEVRQEQEAASKNLQQLVDRERYAREMQNKSFNARKAILEQETLKIKLEGIQEDLAREADRAKDLETQLAESKGRDDSFQRLEAQLSRISETLDKLDEKAEQTADERPEITNKLACEMTQAAAGRSAIEGQIEILEKTVNDHSSLIQAKLKAQQEEMLQRASDNKDENTKLVESMQSREVQVSKMIEAVTELSEKVQDFSDTQELASKGLASNDELLAAQQRLSDSEARLGTLQGELEFRLAVHEVEKREFSEKLQKAEQDLRQQNSALRKSEESRISATRDLAAAYKEQHRELELLYRGAEEARKVLEERFKKASSEASGLERDMDSKLTKELAIAQQRIVNLTLKLRDRETPDATEQLRQQQNEIDGIWRLVRASRAQMLDCGKVYQEVKGLMAAAFSEKIAATQQDCGSVDTQESQDSERSQRDEAPESGDQGLQAQRDPDIDPDDGGTATDAIVIPASDEMVPDTPPAFKRLVIRSPIEESSQTSLPPSVAQEKLQRREMSNQASGLKSILRKRSSSDVPASGSGESPSDHRLAHHNSRSKFNRPVQSAPRGSQETIADARSSLVGNRGGRGPSNTDLTGPGDWGSTETTRMQTHTEPRTKKRHSQSLPDRVAKRIKPFHAEDHDGASLSPSADDSDGRLKNNVRQSGRDSMQNPDSQPQNDRTSHHFRQGASGPKVTQQGQANTQEGELRNAKQASAEIRSQIQPQRPALSKRRISKTYGTKTTPEDG